MKEAKRTVLEQQLYEVLVEVARGETYTIIDDITCEPIALIEPCEGGEAMAAEMAREYGVVRG